MKTDRLDRLRVALVIEEPHTNKRPVRDRLYLQRDDHATGLIRLLWLGLRVLILLEFVVRRQLAAGGLP